MDYDNNIMTTLFFNRFFRKNVKEIMMETEKKKTRGFYVEKGSFFVHACVVLLVVAIAARLLGTMKLWGDVFTIATQIALPVGCALLFILFILLLGRVALWTTILPVLGGAAFFILSVTGESVAMKMIICIVLAFIGAFVYTATLSGMIISKWPNAIVFLLIFACQIAFIAVPAFGDPADPISFADGMTLISSICMVLALLLASLAIRRKKAPEAELPKIKDPKVIPPAAANISAPPAAEAAPAAEITAPATGETPAETAAPGAAAQEEERTE